MNRFKKIICTSALVSAIALGCTKNFEEINTDTNSVTANNYVPGYNLTKAQLEYTGNNDFSYETWRVNIIYLSMMMQQLANTSWYSGDKYIQNDAFASSYFDVAYRDQVKYVVDLLEITRDNALYANLYQIGRIQKVMIFHRLTDIYGDVPYSQAGLGYHKRIFTPQYDAQKDIYTDLLKELEQAAAALDPAKDKPGAADLIYRNGPNAIQQWKKLAYSMMLRIGMRMSKVDAAAAKTWVEKAAAGGVITSVSDNAFILHDATGGRTTVNRNSNILSGEWDAVTKNETFLSRTFVDFFKTRNDPRLPFISRIRSSGNTTPASQIGLPNGYDQNGAATDISTAPGYPGALANYSTIRSDVFLKLAGPTFLVTAAQNEFLLAEAAKRGWTVGGNATTHYNAGVTAAMQQYAQYDAGAIIDGASITAYLTANPYVDANGFEQINTQYWAASFLDWYETWANWRRSGFPALVPVNYTGNATGGKIPRRMLYPAAESSANATNYAAAISRQGANTFLTPVWWDKP
ncbi:MAG: SusD/RagB family nutrient-binding outer membrane lipoprotein [Gemmatimonadaceae bacterium]|nr:SusD/RagB family nutrient-binding outer membrane lipoprotein [Chitinophagaceae bacterium]